MSPLPLLFFFEEKILVLPPSVEITPILKIILLRRCKSGSLCKKNGLGIKESQAQQQYSGCGPLSLGDLMMEYVSATSACFLWDRLSYHQNPT